MRIAIVGATGMVGKVMMEVLKERKFPYSELIPVASEKTVGKYIDCNGETVKVRSVQEAIAMKPEIALFSAGGEASLQYAPRFAEVGTRVIDNSSAWRMSAEHKLIVPEINGNLLTDRDFIVANPNCSTIQLVMVLAPLHRKFRVRRVVVSTYQSITGTGKAAVDQLENERNGKSSKMVYPYPIDMNCLPHCDVFLENGYTKEEMKLTNETKKILDPSIQVTATAVRIPVRGGHSESVNIEFENDFDLGEVRSLLHNTEGIVLQDNPEMNIYPMPKYAEGKNDVFVGRIRRDFSTDKSLNLWIVADNLRKGAATNAVQIAEAFINMQILQT